MSSPKSICCKLIIRDRLAQPVGIHPKGNVSLPKFKDIKNFCEVGLSRKVKTDGTTEPIEETAQN